tara:strand:- start:22582 stop:22704 length:123 start_codon:yes stop_codon:yes gene_type:complete
MKLDEHDIAFLMFAFIIGVVVILIAIFNKEFLKLIEWIIK